MEIKAAFFCDAANISKESKVNILGVFSAIAALSFPAVHNHMTFVVLINGHRSEVGHHSIRINFIDDDGRDFVAPFSGTFEITSENSEANFILNIVNAKFQNPGTYAADIVIDNLMAKSVNLKVILNK